ncbi:signal peptidase I [Paenarthrobacter sp. TYUT067]|uniref:signal peptidase I n=1 Tax=Paenarthrobacter sp. TYUT067 TaxID=2926245 RepID=UPI00202DD8B2|nr:signal peptidase I [Paenarthrobacter sp. TYUT067]MCM0615318.1 signal peptidase I [Paenarthrobacter sp. TYUT067]
MTPKTVKARTLLRSPWIHVLLALMAVSLVQGFLVKVYSVPSGSMEQTLNVGDRVLVNRTAYTGSEPKRGDVVVFRKPAGWGPAPQRGTLRTGVGWFGEVTGIGPANTEYLAKRVVGLPGDAVECCDVGGHVTVNGGAVAEPYVFEDLAFITGSTDCSTTVRSTRCFGPILLGEDQYLLLGDHRSRSEDSVTACRAAGSTGSCVKTAGRADIVGRVDGFLFPFTKWGSAHTITQPLTSAQR